MALIGRCSFGCKWMFFWLLSWGIVNLKGLVWANNLFSYVLSSMLSLIFFMVLALLVVLLRSFSPFKDFIVCLNVRVVCWTDWLSFDDAEWSSWKSLVTFYIFLSSYSNLSTLDDEKSMIFDVFAFLNWFWGLLRWEGFRFWWLVGVWN